MSSTEVAGLEEALSAVVRSVSLWRLHGHFTAEAGVELDRAAYGVLAVLDAAPGSRLSELAGRLGIDISTASRHVQSLEQQGYIMRETDPRDRRASSLALSDAGHDVLERLRQARKRLLASVTETWAPADVAQLSELLGRLNADLQHRLAPERL